MALADKELTCVECGAPFIFTVGEQEFFASRGYTNDPKRCSPCRSARKSQQRVGGGMGGGGGAPGNAPRGVRPVWHRYHGALRSPRRPARLFAAIASARYGVSPSFPRKREPAAKEGPLLLERPFSFCDRVSPEVLSMTDAIGIVGCGSIGRAILRAADSDGLGARRGRGRQSNACHGEGIPGNAGLSATVPGCGRAGRLLFPAD